MNPTDPRQRARIAVKRLILAVLWPFRKLAGRVLQVIEHDELIQLRDATSRLSAASVETMTYLGGEVRRLDHRLQRLEEELAEIRGLLERESAAGAREADPGSRSPTPSV